MIKRSGIAGWVAVGIVLFWMIHLSLPSRILWIGKFDLTIHIQSSEASAIKSVRYRDTWREPDRTSIQHYEWNSLRDAWEVDDSMYQVEIKCTGADDGWGRSLSYGQHDRVLLQVEFDDGSIVRKIVEVPWGRGPREITVQIP